MVCFGYEFVHWASVDCGLLHWCDALCLVYCCDLVYGLCLGVLTCCVIQVVG